jgi:HPr Serine kinase C-terminal domain
MGSFRYIAFGLRLQSNVAVDGLMTAADSASPPDLRLWLGLLPRAFDAAPPPAHEVWRSDPVLGDDSAVLEQTDDGEWFLLTYGDGTRFALRRTGGEIWACWPSGGSLSVAATYLLGPVIGFALRLRGQTCFHASAVVIGGRVILLTGPAGAGKSSAAAALALRGHRVIGDDIAVIDAVDDGWMVHPAIPGIRLWDDMVESLLGRADVLPLLAPGWEKRQYDLRTSQTGFSADASVPLGAIYLLTPSPGNRPSAAVRLGGSEALLALVANTYANVLLTAPLRRAEFLALSAVVRRVPVWRVDAPRSAQELAGFCERVALAGPSTDFAPAGP